MLSPVFFSPSRKLSIFHRLDALAASQLTRHALSLACLLSISLFLSISLSLFPFLSIRSTFPSLFIYFCLSIELSVSVSLLPSLLKYAQPQLSHSLSFQLSYLYILPIPLSLSRSPRMLPEYIYRSLPAMYLREKHIFIWVWCVT